MDLVDEYIKSSRVLKPCGRETSKMRETYRRYYEAICRKGLDYPELRVCYSLSKSCELISLAGREYLIYDQYLGQSFYHLNFLYLNSDKATDEDVYRYMHKCYAEQYYQTGQFDRAALSALIYLEMMKSDRLTMLHEGEEQVGRNYLRGLYGLVQEQFVMLHELCHWELRRAPDRMERIGESRERVAAGSAFLDLIPDYVFFSGQERSAGAKGPDYFDRPAGGEASRGSSSAASPDASEGVSVPGAQELPSQRGATSLCRWADDPVNLEEAYCDEFALGCLLELHPKLQPELVVDACLLGMRNLEMMGFIKLSAREHLPGATPVGRSCLNHQYRRFAFMNSTAWRALNSEGSRYVAREDPGTLFVRLADADQLYADYIGRVILVGCDCWDEGLKERVEHRIDHGDLHRVVDGIPNWGYVCDGE